MTPPLVDLAQIRRQTDGGGYERGLAYFHGGAVRTVTWDPASSVIESVVDGSGWSHYRCRIHLDPGARTSSSCRRSAPARWSRLQAHRRHAAGGQPARGGRRAARRAEPPASWRALLAPPPRAATRRPRRRRSPWESSCGSGCAAAHRAGRPSASRAPRRGACIASAPTSWWDCGRSSAARAAMPGSRAPSRGRCSGGESSGYEPAQARWFTELYSIARDMRLFGSFSDVSEWVTLDDIESHLLLAAAGHRRRARHHPGAHQEAHDRRGRAQRLGRRACRAERRRGFDSPPASRSTANPSTPPRCGRSASRDLPIRGAGRPDRTHPRAPFPSPLPYTRS